jgi:hypothetical protein
MADITNDKGSLEQPQAGTNTQDLPASEEREIDREAEDSAERASERTKRFDKEHDIFTK